MNQKVGASFRGGP